MNVRDVHRPSPNVNPVKHTARAALPAKEKHHAGDETQPSGDGRQVLTQAETEYFEKLFPHAASEIRSYATYRRNGESAAITVGSLIDRKG